MNANEILDNYALPVNQVARQTLIDEPLPQWIKEGAWDRNWERTTLQAKQRQAEQINEVLDKREALGKLADMIAVFKQRTETDAESIREFAKINDLDQMVDFCPWSEWEVQGILDSEPLDAAVKWMHSDHSC